MKRTTLLSSHSTPLFYLGRNLSPKQITKAWLKPRPMSDKSTMLEVKLTSDHLYHTSLYLITELSK